MNNYALNAKNDTYLVQGRIARVRGNDQIAQDIKTKLRTFQGSFFLDNTIYVPYFQTIFEKPLDSGLFDSIVRSVIYLVRGVVNIVDYQSSVDTLAKRYIVNFTVSTINDTLIPISEQFEP